ncbi:MAG: hypothetical protein QMC95_07280 [Desulfitobacteriaceae bacterium]|nr:hypothetical protein [Desulfitobacteriaceae bacterium]MDI6914008.1 hypothetical protein [Desulfitobacteriaceae bacterium]
MLYLIVGAIAILALIFVAYSDYWAGKHSRYFLDVQIPVGKETREANIPNDIKHDEWFHKLNSL